MSLKLNYRLPQPGDEWLHYKGNLYIVHSVAPHSETGEPMVIYYAASGLDDRPLHWVRPLSVWLQLVPGNAGMLRFTFVRPRTGSSQLG